MIEKIDDSFFLIIIVIYKVLKSKEEYKEKSI